MATRNKTIRSMRVLAVLALLVAAPAAAAETCETVSLDGDTTISLQIDTPLPGDELRGWSPDCPDSILVNGIASTVGLPPVFDIYLLIDSSGSTGACSGVDVDGDGTVGTSLPMNACSDPDDTILEAEVQAARDFVDTLSDDSSRVAVLEFSDPVFGRVRTVQSLTPSFAQVQSALDRVAAAGPLGATDFGAAMQEILDEHGRSSDGDREQVALFLSDGQPTAPTPPYSERNGDDNCVGGYDVCNALRRAEEAADRGMVVHTFAVGKAADGEVLRKISSRTDGDHFDIEEPGEIIDVLPGTSLVGIREVVVRNRATSEEARLDPSPDGRYRSGLALVEGLNEIEVLAVAADDQGTEVTCLTDVTVACLRYRCPDDARLECEGEDGAWVDGLLAEASDDGVDIANDSPWDETAEIGDEDASGTYPLGGTEVGFAFLDQAAGARACSTSVLVEDTTAPDLDCPAARVEPAAADCTATLDLAAEADDLCAGQAGVSVTDDAPDDDRYGLGSTLVTFTAEDGFGNSATCDTTVTVEDVTPPEIECPEDRLEDAGQDSCRAILDLEAEASDNCEEETGVEVRDDAPDFFDLGVTVVTFTAVDGTGREDSCTTTVEVRDVVAPEIECPEDTLLETPADDETCQAVHDPVAGAEDLCDPDVDLRDDAPDVFDLGDTLVTHEAEDDSGNLSSCSHTVTLLDATAPVLDCPEAVVLETGDGDDDCAVEYVPAASASDNCDGDLDVVDDAPALFPLGMTVVTFTATDAAGNASNCTQEVTVLDTTRPVLDCPEDAALETGPGDDDCAVAFSPAATARDNCDGDVTVTDDAPALFPVGTTVVTFTARDSEGNESTCAREVTVEDTTPPAIECPEDARLETGPDDSDCLVPFDPPVEARDNCDGSVDVVSDGPGEYGLGTTLVIYEAVDARGNASTCSQEVTVVDTTPPLLTVPADVVLETGPDDIDCAVAYDPRGSAIDNCDPDVPVLDDSPDLFPLGTRAVHYHAEDDSGNAADDEQQVTVIDTTPPRVLFPAGESACLWPPNHRFYCFDSEDWVDTWDNCDSGLPAALACLPDPPGDASTNQPVDSTGDGAFAPDCVVALDGLHGFCVRAERKGDAEDQGPRLYEIGVTVFDSAGNAAADSLAIQVDHDRGGRDRCKPPASVSSYGPSAGYLPSEYPQFRLPGSPGQREKGK